MSLKSATSSVSFNNLINLLRKALLRMSHKTSCINFVLERNKQFVSVLISRLKTSHILTVASIWREKLLEYYVTKREQFSESEARGNLSAFVLTSIVLSQVDAIEFIVLQVSFATLSLLNIGEYHSDIPSFCRGIFSHVTRLDQSSASENTSVINVFMITVNRLT